MTGVSHGVVALAMLSAILGLVTAISYLIQVSSGQIIIYNLSEWAAPFGIILVLDQLSALMLVLTYSLASAIAYGFPVKNGMSVVAIFTPWCISCSWDFAVHSSQATYLTCSFSLRSYSWLLMCLLLHGQGKARFQLGIHYVTINLLASALFLIGLGMIYGSVGSLNMTDVARLIPLLDADAHKIAVAGGLLLFVVFGIKAAMLPVGFWLPKTYAVATTPVAALFTIMTKVGVYAILRVNGTVFDDALSHEILTRLVAADWSNYLTVWGHWRNWCRALTSFCRFYGAVFDWYDPDCHFDAEHTGMVSRTVLSWYTVP